MKYVIARNEGPKYNGSKIGCLTPGKKYEVIQLNGGEWTGKPLLYNPRKTSFYIKIKEMIMEDLMIFGMIIFYQQKKLDILKLKNQEYEFYKRRGKYNPKGNGRIW